MFKTLETWLVIMLTEILWWYCKLVTVTTLDEKSSIVFINIPIELLTRSDKGLRNWILLSYGFIYPYNLWKTWIICQKKVKKDINVFNVWKRVYILLWRRDSKDFQLPGLLITVFRVLIIELFCYIRHPVSGIQHSASSIQYPASSIQYPLSGIHPASNIQYPVSSLIKCGFWVKSSPVCGFFS